MFTERTTFIIGAGASRELNLPLGDTLTTKIGESLQINRNRSDYFVKPAVLSAVISYLQAAKGNATNHDLFMLAEKADQIRVNMPLAPSIDNYLNTHRQDGDIVALGKIGIAHSILDAERNSHLYAVDTNHRPIIPNSGKFFETWYRPFFAALITGVEKHQVSKALSRCAFIIFNYDRCFEHFLGLALTSYFGMSDSEVLEILKKLNIIHVYGQVGELPWTQPTGTPFGSSDTRLLNRVAEQLQTFTESANEGTLYAVREIIELTRTAIFLGFSFGAENMRLMSLEDSQKAKCTRALMTCYGMSPSDRSIAVQKVAGLFHKRPLEDYGRPHGEFDIETHVVSGPCVQLFTDHRLRLAEPAPS